MKLSKSIEEFQSQSISMLMVDLFGIYIHHVYQDLEELKAEIELEGKSANFAKLAGCTPWSKVGFASKNQIPEENGRMEDTMWSIYKCFEFILTNNISDEDFKNFCIETIDIVRQNDTNYYLKQPHKIHPLTGKPY